MDCAFFWSIERMNTDVLGFILEHLKTARDYANVVVAPFPVRCKDHD